MIKQESNQTDQGLPANSLPNCKLQKVAKSHGCQTALPDFYKYIERSNGFNKSGVKSCVQRIIQLMPEA